MDLYCSKAGDQLGAVSISAGIRSRGKNALATHGEDQSMTAYVLVIVLASGGHHQSFAVGYPDQGRALFGRTATAQQKNSWRMPEVRSGQVNCRERDWLLSGTPLSISAVPIRLILRSLQ